MTTQLCPSIPLNYVNATSRNLLFDEDEERLLSNFQKREGSGSSNSAESCHTNLFFGFFFDGTRNNYELSESTHEQSNVARLYDVFPGEGVPDVLRNAKWTYRPASYTHFFKVYIPGVASPFPQINDSGAGYVKTLGGAIGYLGGERIVWALIQAINNVNRYFNKKLLISSDEATRLVSRIVLSKMSRSFMSWKSAPPRNEHTGSWVDARIEFGKLLQRLHSSVSLHWSKGGACPQKVDPGIVKTIHISIFGFSRGATEARAFSNWLDSLCELDALMASKNYRTLGGFPVKFDFLGIFDTVASVNLGNTAGNTLLLSKADGHGLWADAESGLRIPTSVERCVHLVSAHELRRSFPLDSISVGGVLPNNADEIVFPGVHSDVGGGYAPRQQGKGLDPVGSDMLSRLPLIFMYKQARLAGVPLKLELAAPIVQRKFEVKAQVVNDFNAYLSKCTRKTGTLTDIVRAQSIMQMAWRYARRENGPAPLHKIASYIRATNFDKNDLHSANREFNEELRDFEKSIAKRKEKPRRQPAGFRNEVSSEWEEIAAFWPLPLPDPVVMHFFDEYVHDARSAFKLNGDENEEEAIATLGEWLRELKASKALYERYKRIPLLSKMYKPPNYGLTTNQRMAAEQYEKTGAIPLYINEGREPYFAAEAGYFRFRKIYGGADEVLLSNIEPSDLSGLYAQAPMTNSEGSGADQGRYKTV